MKMLYITSLSGHRINGFMRSAIVAAKSIGFDFVMACNTDLMDKENYQKDCVAYGITVRHISFRRNPLDIKNRDAYQQLLSLLEEERFDIVHCNTPIGGLLGRLCAKKVGVPIVIYQAHGFHFYKGAPLKNWLLFFPVEWWLSFYTDILITITKEDYLRAQRLHAKKAEYVHGIGINLSLFTPRAIDDRNETLRKQLGIGKSNKVLLSVGELNHNKNHIIVMKALQLRKRSDLVYVICGDGELQEEYNRYIEENDLTGLVILAGFCSNIRDYYRMADLFVFPSFREGIPGSVMEAMATGVPVLASDTRGIRDIVQDEKYLFNPNNPEKLSKLIDRALNQDHSSNLCHNYQVMEPYSFDNVIKELSAIYESCK